MHRVLFRFDPGGVGLAVLADPGAHGDKRAIHEALRGEMGLMGKIVEGQGRFSFAWDVASRAVGSA